VHRSLHPHQVVRGDPAAVRIVWRNKGGRISPRTVAVEQIDGGQSERTLIHPLVPNESVYRTYPLPTLRRGRILIGPMELRSEDPLGLFARVVADPATDDCFVLPRHHEAHLVAPGRQPEFVGIAALTNLRGATDFQSLREYEIGDDLRHVHWKSLARSNRLMVRQYADPPRPDLTVLLDNRPSSLTPAAFEEAVEIANSLAYAARRGKHRLRLRSTDGHEISSPGDPEMLRRLCEIGQSADTKPMLGSHVAGPLVVITGGSAVAELAALLEGAAASTVAFDLAPVKPAADVSGVYVIRADNAAEAIGHWNTAVAR
jgi:uncharacterized protein (DUF58 family)